VKKKDLLNIDPAKPLVFAGNPIIWPELQGFHLGTGTYDKNANTYYNVGSHVWLRKIRKLFEGIQ
jgi:hypothetical protein